MRNLVIGAAVVGGIVALVQSPLRSKLQERLFGPPPEDDDLPQITLPDDAHEIDVSNASEREIDVSHASDPEPVPAADVVGTAAIPEQSASRGGRGRAHNSDHADSDTDQETNA